MSKYYNLVLLLLIGTVVLRVVANPLATHSLALIFVFKKVLLIGTLEI